jgi:hypothetical protein
VYCFSESRLGSLPTTVGDWTSGNAGGTTVFSGISPGATVGSGTLGSKVVVAVTLGSSPGI